MSWKRFDTLVLFLGCNDRLLLIAKLLLFMCCLGAVYSVCMTTVDAINRVINESVTTIGETFIAWGSHSVFSYFWDPYDHPGSPLERETTPCNFPKSVPGRPLAATELRKTLFYDVFLMFFVDGPKSEEIL